jgi:hypothetical protein
VPLRNFWSLVRTGSSFLQAKAQLRPERERGAASESLSEFGENPGPGHLPIAHGALGRNLQHFRRFLDAQSTEESKLEDSCFAGVDFIEFIQRVLDGIHLPGD